MGWRCSLFVVLLLVGCAAPRDVLPAPKQASAPPPPTAAPSPTPVASAGADVPDQRLASKCEVDGDGAQVAVMCDTDAPSYFDLSKLSGPIAILSLVGVKAHDLSALPALPIEQLEIQLGGIADLHGIERLGKLSTVVIVAPALPNLAALQNTDVSSLQLSVDEKTNLGALGTMRRLEELDLDVKDDSELPSLPGLSHLRTLDISGGSITKLDALSRLHSLEDLSIDARKVDDVTPLAGLARLRSLTLDFTKVSDLKPLSGLSQLELLRIGNTPVTDLSPLHKLAKLRELEIFNTSVSKQNVARLRRALPKCVVHGPLGG